MSAKQIKNFNQLKKNPVFRHAVYATLSIMVITWIITRILSWYTNHNNIIIVPDLSRLPVEKIDDYLTNKELDIKYVIIDSVYKIDFPKGTVFEQDPKAGSKVKPNRTIYLTVTARGNEKTSMPNLIDLSLKQATATLETYGLRLGKMEYVPDIAKNAVLKQIFNNNEIQPGTKINKGSIIDLVVGDGLGSSDSATQEEEPTLLEEAD